jgi:hypothetical protein
MKHSEIVDAREKLMQISSSIRLRISESHGVSRRLLKTCSLKTQTLCLALLLICGVAMPHLGYAQSASAAVNGTVADTTGALIQDTQIVLRNVDTGAQKTTLTGPAGTYSITDILPGNYSMRAVKDGFKTEERTGIVLQVNQTGTLDFVLSVGSSTQTVVVTANLSTVESTTAELGTVISKKPVIDLPLNGRNFTQLLTLTPGVSPISVGQIGRAHV